MDEIIQTRFCATNDDQCQEQCHIFLHSVGYMLLNKSLEICLIGSDSVDASA